MSSAWCRGRRVYRLRGPLLFIPVTCDRAFASAPPMSMRRCRSGKPEAYVRATLVNLATDRARRRHLVAVPVHDAHGSEPHTVGHDADALVAQEQLDALLAPLPSRQRATVVLRVIEGYSERETAHLMRCSPGTVKNNLARGLDTLRARAATASIEGITQ